MAAYPHVFRVRQHLPRPQVGSIPAAVAAALDEAQLAARVRPGQQVAVTAGSRGIANIADILTAIVAHLQRLGAHPFLVPAMGSHGGATADGQRRVLARHGITEARCGCPIRASMETVVVCQAEEGFPVRFDRQAYEADHVLVCGRVKPHTRFVADIESGLLKMMLVGLGKHAGAQVYHQAIQDYDFGQIIRSVAREVLQRCRIVGGVAILDNAYDETARIVGVPPDAFEARERELLRQARAWMPRLPFHEADVLLLDEIGKEVSGTGLDTNVVGRKHLDHAAREDEFPKIKYLVVRGLTQATHGNANGIGLAEFCRSQVLRAMDVHATRTNSLAGSHATAAMLPLDYETDREILDAVLSVIGLRAAQAARLMWIRNTLQVGEVECAEAYWSEARQRADLEIRTPPRPLPLGVDGQLPDLAAWC